MRNDLPDGYFPPFRKTVMDLKLLLPAFLLAVFPLRAAAISAADSLTLQEIADSPKVPATTLHYTVGMGISPGSAFITVGRKGPSLRP